MKFEHDKSYGIDYSGVLTGFEKTVAVLAEVVEPAAGKLQVKRVLAGTPLPNRALGCALVFIFLAALNTQYLF